MREMIGSKARTVGLSAVGIVAFLLFARVPPACAGIENRPSNTDDAYTLQKGTWAMSTGFVATQAANGDEEMRAAFDVGYGITDTVEVSADFPYSFFEPQSGKKRDGFGDFAVRPEWMFLKESATRPAVSLALLTKFDNGNNDKNLGSGAIDTSASLQASKQFSRVTVHLNGGITFVGEPTGVKKDNVLFYNLGWEYALGRRNEWKIVGELVGQTNSDPKATEDPLEWLLGFTFAPKRNLVLDAGFGMGLTEASPDYRVTSGVTIYL